ncbi:MAG: molybdenum cofactor guanylyltransferase [Synergistaceae bacterium]|nr:molybdenum cofactor guanylyltransferase [Synergistaceae bacterium]
MDRKMKISALVLAGGRGERMGREKLFLSVDSTPLVERVLRAVHPFAAEVLLSVASCQVAPALGRLSGIIRKYGIRLVEDRSAGRGPLEGIASGLAFAKFGWSFVCACDMPFLSLDVIRALWKGGDQRASVILPRIGGYLEPLHAFYSLRALSAARKLLDQGERKISALYDKIPVSIVDEETFTGLYDFRRSFYNMNLQKDLSVICSPD